MSHVPAQCTPWRAPWHAVPLLDRFRAGALNGHASNERLGRHRWVVERTIAWVLAFRRLSIRYDRHAISVLAFLHLACALICVRFLRRAETP